MNRKSAAAWTLYVVPVVAAGFFYARNHRVFRRALERLQRATRAIDASLAEMRDKQPDRDDAAVVERARREFKDIDFVAFAEYLQLEREQSKQQEQ